MIDLNKLIAEDIHQQFSTHYFCTKLCPNWPTKTSRSIHYTFYAHIWKEKTTLQIDINTNKQQITAYSQETKHPKPIISTSTLDIQDPNYHQKLENFIKQIQLDLQNLAIRHWTNQLTNPITNQQT